MSQKITSKNLQYTSSLPPFLARLRGQNAAETDPDGPDPILASRRRPVKPRSGSAEAEDAPLVVDEHGNTVDVTVGADGAVTEKEVQKNGGSAGPDDKEQGGGNAADADQQVSGEKLAEIGAQRKKRKIGKVIGGGADEEVTTDKTAEVRDGANDKRDPAPTTKTKPKKAKKIKLSFGDDES